MEEQNVPTEPKPAESSQPSIQPTPQPDDSPSTRTPDMAQPASSNFTPGEALHPQSGATDSVAETAPGSVVPQATPSVQPTPSDPKTTSSKMPGSGLKKTLLPFLIFLGILLLGGLAFAAYTIFNPKPSAEEVFNAFPARAMDVSSVKAGFSADAAIAKVEGTAEIDYRDPEKVKTKTHSSVEINFFANAKITQNTLDNGDDQFLMIESYEISGLEEFSETESSSNEIEPLLGKWIRTSDPDLPDELIEDIGAGDLGFTEFGQINGELIFFDFNAEQETSLIDHLAQNPVYSYDGEPVEETVDGVQTYRYNVVINFDNLVLFNQKVQEILGIDEELDLDDLGLEDATVTLWLNIDSGLPQKLSYDADFDGISATSEVKFSDYNQSFDFAAPEDVLSTQEVIDLVESVEGAGASQSNNSSPSDIQTAESRDLERKIDLQAMEGHLEAYAAKNGFYPTSGNMTDPDWIEANFLGLDIEALIDPFGTGYTYVVGPAGCDNTASSECQTYQIFADLEEDGWGENDADGDTDDYMRESNL